MSTTSHAHRVPTMSCQHCVDAISKAVDAVNGVERVDVDLDAKTVQVIGGTPDDTRAAIEAAGYEVA